MKNPYKMVTKTGEPLPENLRFRGRQSPAIAASGEFNAYDKKDLMKSIAAMIEASRQGDIRRPTTEEKRAVSRDRRQALQQAFNDDSGQHFKALGEVLAEDIYETTEREGFTRKLFSFREIEQGGVARVRFRNKEVVAFIATTASNISPVFVRSNFIYLPLFYVGSNILIEERDIGLSTGDVLEEKYQEGLEAIMVQEDRLWKTFADSAATVVNTLTYFTTFTPGVFSQIRSQVTGWGIPAAYTLLAYDLWDDIIGTVGFSDWFDPVTMHELVLEGQLGTMLGTTLLTDAFRLPEQKVLEAGEIYVVGPPENHGVIQQLGDLNANPINTYDQGAPNRGWYIFEMLAMMLVNAKSVAGGKRS
jgi:hypothetical protein